jgi:DtxR family Mn-dependent transcriptional regulator
MTDPAFALLTFFAGVAAALVAFMPRIGVVPRVVGLLRMTERVRIEDALKHLYNAEYAERPLSVDALAGVLEVRRARATRLVALLEAQRLARIGEIGVTLSDEGRAYALRVLRTHRLWERYLADRTGVPPADWHPEAELREHTLSPDEAEALSARLGHPRYDPHGDPIPTAAGEMPPAAGVPLAALAPGDVAEIAHVEDEPAEVYRRLLAAGLHPQVRIRILEPADGLIRFHAAGRDHALEPVVVAGVTVEPLHESAAPDPSVVTLAAVKHGESARVVGLSRACRGPQRRRLLDLGVVPGTRITARLTAAGGDPVAYEIRGALIALRREQAEWVRVRREGAAEEAA